MFLVRHGETTAEGRFLGASDAPLSPEGVRQAEALAAELAGAGVRLVVSSALQRARRTAAVLAGAWRVPHRVDARLNEKSYGVWDGLTWEEIERADPAGAAAKLADWWGYEAPGAESREGFLARVAGAWGDLRDEAAPLAVVAHAGVNALLAELVRGGEPDWERVTRFRQGHGTALELDGPRTAPRRRDG